MFDTSIDMLLQESILDDSATALMEGDSIVYQDALCQSRGQEILTPNQNNLNHNNLPSTNEPQSPPYDLSQNFTMVNDEARCSDLETSPSSGFPQPAQGAIREQQKSGSCFQEGSHLSMISSAYMQRNQLNKFSDAFAGEQLTRCAVRLSTSKVRHANDDEVPERDQEKELQAFVHAPVFLEWRCQKQYHAFKPKLSQSISTFASRHRRISIREYKSMSDDDQHLERERVVSLLYRLGIDTGSRREFQHNGVVSRRLESRGSKNLTLCQHTMGEYCNGSDIQRSNELDFSWCGDKRQRNLRGRSNTEYLSQPFSAEKLSPIRGGEKSQDLSPMHRWYHNISHPLTGGSFLDASIETTRQADSPSRRLSLYQSPPLPVHGSTAGQPNIHKRLASTSGKRGKDAFRIKYSSDSSSDGSPTPALHPSSPEDSVSFLAADEVHPLPFSASQSLIESSPRRPCEKTCSSDYSASKLSLDETQSSRSYRDLRQSTITSDITELVDGYHGKLRWKQVSTNLALKEGVPLHYNPLQIQVTTGKRRKEVYKREPPMSPSVEFRDPLKAFVGEGGQALQHVFEWIRVRDRKTSARCDKWSSDSNGIVFSLASVQIVSVIMKLLSDVGGHSRYELRCNEDCESLLIGQTLIVVRSKQDIAVWERALREHTPFSVANHADLASIERKHSGTAAKCATFDVVLTTYDALKSPDITIQVDEDGHAVFGQGAKSYASFGWMVKRAQGNSQRMESQGIGSAALCKKLSGLHTVWWRRIVFVDELGKKCFLAKQGTSRAYAAGALGGAARFLFFPRHTSSNGMRTAFEALLRSDKRSIQYVASTLRIEVDHTEEDLLGVMIDLEDEFSN